ncbi:hypothetical protein PQR75_05535 [Paraburkholderia fungorum]|jgi:hypothetical protein|uniref:DUF5677 domain-containing protein n=1 Tax=Paraburkholderia fungorum TaxID=134537 RepID=UPI0038BBC508
MRDEYKFAKDYLEDQSKNPKMHPFLRELGCRAIAGDERLTAEEVEYLLSLTNPDRALKDYVMGRPYLAHLPTGGNLKVNFREKFRKAFPRKWRQFSFLLLYVLFAALASGPFLFSRFLFAQISRLMQTVTAISRSNQPRVGRLHALYSAIIEDAISVRILGDNARLNQAYIISRALLERLTNFCFLQICPQSEFADYIDYSLNKAGRRMDRAVGANGEVKARIALNSGDFELPPDIIAAVAKISRRIGFQSCRTGIKRGFQERSH